MRLGTKLLIWSFALIFVLLLLAPVRLGPVMDFRIMHILRETGALKDNRTPEQLISALESSDIRVAVDAIMVMSRQQNPDPRIVKVLRQFIDTKAPYSLQNLAIYALGELRVREALPQLESRLRDFRYDQQELRDAIDKISGVKQRPFWKAMF
jgi:hypothetical protein